MTVAFQVSHCHWKSLKLRKYIPVDPHQPVSEPLNNSNTYAHRNPIYTKDLEIPKFVLEHICFQIEKNFQDIFERFHIPYN